MNIKYKIIEDKFDRYNIYSEALTWDTKNTYNTNKEKNDLSWLLNTFIGVYNEEELVALGSIRKYFKNDTICANISYIVKPEYRKKGIGNNLIKYLLEYSKNDLDVKMVYVDILKNNKESVSQIEKNDFDFKSFNDKIISFQKKLI